MKKKKGKKSRVASLNRSSKNNERSKKIAADKHKRKEKLIAERRRLARKEQIEIEKILNSRKENLY